MSRTARTVTHTLTHPSRGSVDFVVDQDAGDEDGCAVVIFDSRAPAGMGATDRFTARGFYRLLLRQGYRLATA